ncbi:MAG: Uma2 family endonuclease [Hyphomicrobiales bacterium]|nr:Uma2 family endonuclease [Hyphomicrobiales bacterium]
MTVEEFLKWNLSQDERYELVDGVPVPMRAMAGATDQHDTITINLIVALGNQLRGSGCRPKTSDTAVRTKIKSVRRPDVTIECAPVQKGSLEAGNPIAVFEVLSPTTRQIDRTIKLEEYRRHPTLRTIVHIDPDVMDVLVYTRDPDGTWNDARLDRPDDSIRLPDLPVALALSDLYEGVPVSQEASRSTQR